MIKHRFLSLSSQKCNLSFPLLIKFGRIESHLIMIYILQNYQIPIDKYIDFNTSELCYMPSIFNGKIYHSELKLL